MRAATALAVATGSRSLLLAEQAQRLVREALFCLVYALRPSSRAPCSRSSAPRRRLGRPSIAEHNQKDGR
jgi:hypothetical protein